MNCEHCKRLIEERDGGTSCILDLPEQHLIKRYCCLACLLMALLDDLGLVGQMRLPMLDVSWFPVMKNLHNEIARPLIEASCMNKCKFYE